MSYDTMGQRERKSETIHAMHGLVKTQILSMLLTRFCKFEYEKYSFL